MMVGNVCPGPDTFINQESKTSYGMLSRMWKY